MFGPLPRLHKVLVVTVALAVGLIAGFWFVHSTPLPALVAAGIGWGVLTGVLLAYLLLHDFHHRPRPVRVRRH